MAEWLHEAGIGESRAALVVDGRIVQARIERADRPSQVGAVRYARVVEVTRPGHAARVRFDDDSEALLAPLGGTAEGRRPLVLIVRDAIRELGPEPGREKLARAMPTDLTPRPAPDLLARITASGRPVRTLLPHQPDALEAAGWSEVLGEARTGEIAFSGGALRMSPTPAMTLFDVDGAGPLEPLAIAAAHATAAAIVRHDIAGSIGIDFPTLAGREARSAVAGAIDAALPQPFERTAVNGFGFLQIIRRRERPSLPELIRADLLTADALALLREAERIPPGALRIVQAAERTMQRIAARADWLEALRRRTGQDTRFEIRR